MFDLLLFRSTPPQLLGDELPVPAALSDVATAASQAATAATADPSMRQLTVAESFQRATQRRTGDPGHCQPAERRPAADDGSPV